MSLLAPVSKSVKGLLNRALFLPDPKGRNEDGSAANWSKDFYDAYLETMYIIRDSTDPKDLKNASKFLSKRSSSILWAIFSSRELLKLLLRQIWGNPATFLRFQPTPIPNSVNCSRFPCLAVASRKRAPSPNNATTQRLTSSTNPENGTVTNYYNADGTLSYKVDAKSQKISYDYDSLKRVTAVHRYPNGITEDTNQRTDFEYDTNSIVSGFSQNISGRLAVATSRVNATAGLTSFYEMYSYDSAGRVLKKRLRVQRGSSTVDKDVEYSYNQALMSTMKYPDETVPYSYSYDLMLRRHAMSGPYSSSTPVQIVDGVTYNEASRITAYTTQNLPGAPGALSHTFTFNERNELTRQQSGSVTDIQYEYSATTDNGQIVARTNAIAAEKVTYQYDALKRLIGATAINTNNSATNWATAYSYDGFGNLLSKTPTAGSAPALSVNVDGTTNRIQGGGFGYDANGNLTAAGGATGTYDTENRLVAAAGEEYGYLTSNKRIYKRDASGAEWIYLHDAWGRRLVQYQLATNGSVISLVNPSANLYFVGRTLSANGTAVVRDRLGSVVYQAGSSAQVDYFPYGEEKTSANPAEKFGTYLRDASGLDFADQWFYWSMTGRFLSPDPSSVNIRKTSSITWNAYAYTNGAPSTFNDPSGLGLWSTLMGLLGGSGASGTGVSSGVGGGGSPEGDMEEKRENNWDWDWDVGGGGGGGGGGSFCSDGDDECIETVFTTTVSAKCPDGQTEQANGSCATPPVSGIGIGVLYGGSVDLGYGSGGATAQGNVAVGVFGSSNGPAVGASLTGARAAFTPTNRAAAYPAQPTPPTVAGVYAGVGPGVFITNAGNMLATSGSTFSMQASIGFLAGGTFSFSSSPSGIWVLGLSGGTPFQGAFGFGLSFSTLTTCTATVGTEGHSAFEPCP